MKYFFFHLSAPSTLHKSRFHNSGLCLWSRIHYLPNSVPSYSSQSNFRPCHTLQATLHDWFYNLVQKGCSLYIFLFCKTRSYLGHKLQLIAVRKLLKGFLSSFQKGSTLILQWDTFEISSSSSVRTILCLCFRSLPNRIRSFLQESLFFSQSLLHHKYTLHRNPPFRCIPGRIALIGQNADFLQSETCFQTEQLPQTPNKTRMILGLLH